jgi:hypothetical protein
MMNRFRNTLLHATPTKWRRVAGPGLLSAWTISAGARFLVEMHCHGCGRFLSCAIDGDIRDMTDLAQGPGVREWIRDSWARHLAGLSWHERAEYVSQGLLREEADPPGG